MHPRIEELFRHLDTTREELRQSIDSVPVDLRHREPAGDRWSVAGVVEHLAILEPRLAAMIRKRIAEARAAGVGQETDDSPVLSKIDMRKVLDRSYRIEAPEPLHPKGNLDVEQAWAALKAAREELKETIRASDGIALGQISHSHPAFGPLNLYEWIAFVGTHEARHSAQIREIGSRV